MSDESVAVKMPSDLATPQGVGGVGGSGDIEAEVLSPAAQDQRLKILHLLETFPYISRAMIQVGLGPALPPKLWDPILANLVETQEVSFVEVNVTTPSGRALVKGIYHLPTFPYPPQKLQAQIQLNPPNETSQAEQSN